jgi:hypothetical protein
MTQPQHDAVKLIAIFECDWEGEPTDTQLDWLYSQVDKLNYDEWEKFHDIMRVLIRNATFEVKYNI